MSAITFFPLNMCFVFVVQAGFTAWSSVREPSQVFILLESLYHAFDQIAKRRRVFKVETIGDCYVAVTGLPEPRDDHAVVMARFANDCLKKTRILTKKLIVVLGPDTEDLTMRCVSLLSLVVKKSLKQFWKTILKMIFYSVSFEPMG